MNFKAVKGNVLLINRTSLPASRPSKSGTSFTYAIPPRHPTIPEEVITEGSNSWTTQIEVKALQPQRELSPPSDLLIGAKESCEVIVSARIYADTLPQPLAQDLNLSLKVKKVEINADELVKEFRRSDEEAGEDSLF